MSPWPACLVGMAIVSNQVLLPLSATVYLKSDEVSRRPKLG